MSNKTFQLTGGARPGYSAFDLSYKKLFTCDMGQLIPVMCDEVVPGDRFKIANEVVVRMQPIVAPILHEIDVYTHYFFVPYRLLWDDWEKFITGDTDGEDASVLPRWTVGNNFVGTLWDYLGFQTSASCFVYEPMKFPQQAYNLIWNSYYMDQTLQTPVNLDTNEAILLRNWEKDYFTSALPWQQRGITPSLPLSGTTNVEWPDTAFTDQTPAGSEEIYVTEENPPKGGRADLDPSFLHQWLELAEVDFANASTFDIADLRLAFQIQRWQERNARCGARYTEFLNAHFAVSPRDERLQRPEYLGGTKNPVIVSEVLQTSESDTTPQGTMAGHGITAASSFIGSYRAEEFGLIMGIMSIMPKPAYQQGYNRQWMRRTRYDFYFPEFANLSEQAIENGEIFVTDNNIPLNEGIFGYQGKYDEMRYKPNMVCGEMRTTFDYWHLCRQFASLPALNSDFLECNPDKRIFAVENEPGFIVSYGNLIKAIRPIPIQSTPGLIDHG